MKVVTRFAPSPTGELHIGGARTALFNFLYAKHIGGIFRLRIEDTDKKRSTKEFEQSIINGLNWLGLHHDGEIVYQSLREKRHIEVAQQLLTLGHAYYCYTPLEEIQNTREKFEDEGKVLQFKSEWRNKQPTTHTDIKPVIRFKAPQSGTTTINDLVQGKVTVPNTELDDMVLLRSDSSATYMFAVVVDDHDMDITHVIRGDDHLNNAFRQIHLYHALGWQPPEYGHIPLIHSMDGSKLSKRHGALGVMYYKDSGYLPEALNNYLLRLGWGHGNDEIISQQQAIEWFDIKDVHRNPAKLDFDKMTYINAQYIKKCDEKKLVGLIEPILKKTLTAEEKSILIRGMSGLKLRARTLLELAASAKFYLAELPLEMSEQAQAIISNFDKMISSKLNATFTNLTNWDEESIKASVKEFATIHGVELGDVAQLLRALLTGSTVSPSVFEIMYALGKEKSIERINFIK